MIETTEMIERLDKRFVHCPVCGKCLMKASGNAEIETKCDRCGSDLIAIVRGGMVSVSEDRRNILPNRQGAVSVSVSKEGGKKSRELHIQKKASSY